MKTRIITMLICLIALFLISSFGYAAANAVNIGADGITFPDNSVQNKAAVLPTCSSGDVLVNNSGSWYCGKMKLISNGIATCVGSVCSVSTCMQGYSDNGNGVCIPPDIELSSDKMTAVTPILMGGSTTISFNFGTSVANGTVVTYTTSPASAVLSNKTNVTNGIATVYVTSPTQSIIFVTAKIEGASGTKKVQFIPQPDKVVVHVALTKTISDLSGLVFGLRNNLGVTCPYTSTTLATGYTNYNAPNSSSFLTVGNDVYLWYIFQFGLNTIPSKNLLDMTFTPTAFAGIPFFVVFQYPNNPQDLSYYKYMRVTSDPGTDTQSATNIVSADFIITTDYYLGATLLATK